MQVLLIKFCSPLRKGSTKVSTKVGASFAEASFVSRKEEFQQKFPQKLLQVLLKQVLFPVRVGLSPGKCTSILGSGAYAMSFQSKIPNNRHFSPHFLARKNWARSVALHFTLIPIESTLQPCNNQHGGGR